MVTHTIEYSFRFSLRPILIGHLLKPLILYYIYFIMSSKIIHFADIDQIQF